jgi:DNA-binding transcriptional regulator YiaG
MNPTAQEIMSYYGISNELDGESLEHYGIPRRSGRYPWGSGEDPYQHENRDFLGRVDEMRKAGFTYTDEKGKKWTGDTAIAKSMGLSTTQFRTEIAIANDERRTLNVETAKRLRDKEGLNPTEIGRKMGVNESTVRSWFNEEAEVRTKKAKETANFLKEQVDGKRMVDVGADVERELNISRQKLDQAIYMLEREGYHIYQGRMPQPTNPGKFTTTKVLAAPDVEHKEIFDWGNVKTVNDYISRDNGETYEKKFHYPESLDSKRLMIRYAEDGGIQKDGLVELRRGVDDLSLGDSHYSQVRIMVDGTHYIKGMAAYSDDSSFPKGVDVIFNTNKSKSVAKMDVLKKIKDDPDNPFGSLIKDSEQGGQYWYTDKKTGEKKLGLINKRADEGDWNEWADKVPSQFLSKQSKTMAKKQLIC